MNNLKSYIEYTLLGVTVVVLLSLIFLTWLAVIPQYSRMCYYYLFFLLSSLSIPFIFSYLISKAYGISIELSDIIDLELNKKALFFGIIGAVAGFIFGMLAAHLQLVPIFVGQLPSTLFKALLAFNIGLNEELFFRGLVFGLLYWVILIPSIRKGKIPKSAETLAFLFAAVTNSILFAIYHAYVYGMSSSLMFLFVFGLLMSVLRYYGSIWGAIMFHSMYDLAFFMAGVL